MLNHRHARTIEVFLGQSLANAAPLKWSPRAKPDTVRTDEMDAFSGFDTAPRPVEIGCDASVSR